MYPLFIWSYTALIHLAALWQPKAGRWVTGRRDWRKVYSAGFRKSGPVFWLHAASLGEFEQGRPLIEAMRARYPGWQIVLTFFSPSGYEIRKNYPQADYVFYLPADTRQNARQFLDIIRPDVAVFVKYEFWANYLAALHERGIPTLLVSALFRPKQPFFQPWGGFWRRMLACFTHIFVQNEPSARLLRSIGFLNSTVAGDTRVDRVQQLAAAAPENDVVRAFAAGQPVFIAGSSWKADEDVFLPVLLKPDFQHFKIIIAPHEPSERHLQQLIERLPPGQWIRYSRATPENAPGARLLLIDNVGLLNQLYRYGTLAYIGGGFGKGIHNTLEPAAYGLPVIFGPNYQKFEEARQLVARGGAFAIVGKENLSAALHLLAGWPELDHAQAAVLGFLAENRGATAKILEYIGGLVQLKTN